MKVFIAFKFAGTNPQECNPIPVLRVQVRVYLENESAKLIFVHVKRANIGLAAAGSRCDADKCIEHFVHAEIIHGASEEDGRDSSRHVIIRVQLSIYPIY